MEKHSVAGCNAIVTAIVLRGRANIVHERLPEMSMQGYLYASHLLTNKTLLVDMLKT